MQLVETETQMKPTEMLHVPPRGLAESETLHAVEGVRL